jgi:hypothetical protein
MIRVSLKLVLCCLLFIVLLHAAPAVSFAELEIYTHRLAQSTSQYLLWTTPPSERVFKDTVPPVIAKAEVKVYAAKNEFEPFLLVVQPISSGNVQVTINDFGSGITTQIHQVKYVNIVTPTDYLGRTGTNPDPLWPLANGATVSLAANQNTALWFTVHVPKTAPAGDYTTSVQIGGIVLPVTLHVFNFTLPAELHVKSQMNFSYETILSHYSVPGTGAEYWAYVDKMKQFFIDHRLTSASVLWSGGLTQNGGAPYIDYNCATHTFTDTYGIWGFEAPAARYLAGTGLMGGIFAQAFNGGVGFSSSMAVSFQNNDASADQRPSTFCGQTRTSADWYTGNNPTSPYNQQWFAYITAIQNYLQGLGYLDKAYYYIANEPQDQADYDAVSWYSRYLHAAAPNLKLMVSEEPKSEIYDQAGAKIDIWLAHLGLQFDPVVAGERLLSHDEETWIYFLHGTRLPRFNPITIDHPGVEGKLGGWFLWKYRLRGIGYYSFNNWGSNPWTTPLNSGQNGNLFLMYPPSEANTPIAYGANGHNFVPSTRLELLRDGLDDYEYLYLLNAGNQPQPKQTNPADEQVDKIIGYTVAYSRDSEFLYNLRRLIGQKVGGEIAAIPDIAPTSTHPRSEGVPANYYINFQDPDGQPIGDVISNGHSYMKIGDALYSTAAGYGWIRAADVPDSDFYPSWDQWIDPEPKALLGSSVIDSWGREDVFEFDLPNGVYRVTACAGSRSSPRYQNIVIEGVVFMDDEVTNNSWLTRTKKVAVRDKKLTLVMGKYDRIGYINYLNIEAAETDGDLNCDGVTDLKDVISILQVIGGGAPELSWCGKTLGDLDGNSRIGLEDGIAVLQRLAP